MKTREQALVEEAEHHLQMAEIQLRRALAEKGSPFFRRLDLQTAHQSVQDARRRLTKA